MNVRPTNEELRDLYEVSKQDIDVNKHLDINEWKKLWLKLLKNNELQKLQESLLEALCVYDAKYTFSISVWHGNIVFRFKNKQELVDHISLTIDALGCKILGEEDLPDRIAYIEFVRIYQTIEQAKKDNII